VIGRFGHIYSQVFLIVYPPMFRAFTTISCKTELINFAMTVFLSVCLFVSTDILRTSSRFYVKFYEGVSTQTCLHVSPWLKLDKNHIC
jgi:hypothetical protein